MKLAVVGATGLVGKEILDVLEEFGFTDIELLPVASEKSIGKEIEFANRRYKIISMEEAILKKPDLAIFSAGAKTSLEYAPRFVEAGATVIDNSSAWRKEKNIPLIVPEVNIRILTKRDKLIANPNCSTIQLVVALAPLHERYRIKRVVISTYQSVTGSGAYGVKQLKDEQQGIDSEKFYPHRIHENLFPHGGNFQDDGYTTEEQKLVNETRKILDDNSIQLTATVVRAPVLGGHSEAVNVEFWNEYDINDVKNLLKESQGIIVQDAPEKNIYPTPIGAKGKNEVFIGRIRPDFSQPNSLNFWVVSDNLRKGAATNAVQIMQYILQNRLIDATM